MTGKRLNQLQFSSIDELNQQAEEDSQISVHTFNAYKEYVDTFLLSFKILSRRLR